MQKRNLLYVLLAIFLALSFLNLTCQCEVTTTQIAGEQGTIMITELRSSGRHCFMDGNDVWLFYEKLVLDPFYHGVGYTMTDDAGSSWTSYTEIPNSTNSDCRSSSLYWYDNTVYYSLLNRSSGALNKIVFGQATINSTGDGLDFSSQITVSIAETNCEYRNCPEITIDTNGNLWIISPYLNGSSQQAIVKVFNSTNDGDSWNFNCNLGTWISWTDSSYSCKILSLTNGKLYALIGHAGASYRMDGYLYDGSSWGTKEDFAEDILSCIAYSAIAYGDSIYFAYTNGSYYKLLKRENDTWGELGNLQVVSVGTPTSVTLTRYEDDIFAFMGDGKKVYLGIIKSDDSIQNSIVLYEHSVNVYDHSLATPIISTSIYLPVCWTDSNSLLYGSIYNIYGSSSIKTTNQNAKSNGNPHIWFTNGTITDFQNKVFQKYETTFTLTQISGTVTETIISGDYGLPEKVEGADNWLWDGRVNINVIHSSSQTVTITWGGRATSSFRLRVHVSQNTFPYMGASVFVNGENETTNLLGDAYFFLSYGSYEINVICGEENQTKTVALSGDMSVGFNFDVPIKSDRRFYFLIVVPIIVPILILVIVFFGRRK